MVSPAPLYLLAGGRSERMGQDKARLPIGGAPLLLHVVRQCGYLPSQVTVVAAPGRSYSDLGLQTIEDAQAHEGPFAGLLTVLERASSPWIAVAACDQWGLQPSMLRALEAAVEAGAVAAAYRGERWHPVPMVVRADAVASVRAAFATGERSLWRWLEQSGAAALPAPDGWSEVVSVDDAAALERVAAKAARM